MDGVLFNRARTMLVTRPINDIDRIIYDVDGASLSGSVREKVNRQIMIEHEKYLSTLREKLSGREL